MAFTQQSGGTLGAEEYRGILCHHHVGHKNDRLIKVHLLVRGAGQVTPVHNLLAATTLS